MPLQTSLSPQPTKLGPEPLVFYLWAAVAGDVAAVAAVAGVVGGGNLALGSQLPNTTAHGALHCCTDQRRLSSTGSSHHPAAAVARRAVNRPSRSFTVPVLIERDYDAKIMTGTLVSIESSRHLSEDDSVKLLKCITVLNIYVSKQ